MDFKRIIDLITSANIDTNKMYDLIGMASELDLIDEDNQRLLIQKGFELAGKNLDINTENQIIEIIKEKGISQSLFDILK